VVRLIPLKITMHMEVCFCPWKVSNN
jgi:hypothetical protein